MRTALLCTLFAACAPAETQAPLATTPQGRRHVDAAQGVPADMAGPAADLAAEDAAPAPPDLAPPGPDATPCGQAGEVCCNGTGCGSSTTCLPYGTTVHCFACGYKGAVCCKGACGPGTVCQPPGSANAGKCE